MGLDPLARTAAAAHAGSAIFKLPIRKRLSLPPYSAPRRRPEPNPAARDCSDRPTPPASIAWSMLFRCYYARGGTRWPNLPAAAARRSNLSCSEVGGDASGGNVGT
jgi:hypothetical protein